MRCMSASSSRYGIISMRCARRLGSTTLVLLGAILMHAATPHAATQFRIFGGRDGRRVTLRAADGAPLSAVYYEPSRRPAPGIILLHMLGRSHTDWDAAASQLSDAGFAVLALDFRSGEDTAALATDVRGAKAFLRERPEVIPNGIGIAGASIAANLALVDAADDPGVMSIALLSPGLDYKGVRTEAAMKKYGGRSALLIGSTKDPYSARSIKHLSTIGPGTREVRLIDAAGHGTVLLSRDSSLIPALVDWFKRTL
jgi:dienelactone hydrolase